MKINILYATVSYLLDSEKKSGKKYLTQHFKIIANKHRITEVPYLLLQPIKNEVKSIGNYTLKELHLSFYERKHNKTSDYHVSMILIDESNSEYKARVHYNMDDPANPFCTFGLADEEMSMSLNMEGKGYFCDVASYLSVPVIRQIERMGAQAITDYEKQAEEIFQLFFSKQIVSEQTTDNLIALANEIKKIHPFPCNVTGQIRLLEDLKKPKVKKIEVTADLVLEASEPPSAFTLPEPAKNVQKDEITLLQERLKTYSKDWLKIQLISSSSEEAKALNALADKLLQEKGCLPESLPIEKRLAFFTLEQAVFTKGKSELDRLLLGKNFEAAKLLPSFYPKSLNVRMLELAIKCLDASLVDFILSNNKNLLSDKLHCLGDKSTWLVDYILSKATIENKDKLMPMYLVLMKYGLTPTEVDEAGHPIFCQLLVKPAYQNTMLDIAINFKPAYFERFLLSQLLKNNSPEVDEQIKLIQKIRKENNMVKAMGTQDFVDRYKELWQSLDLKKLKELTQNDVPVRNLACRVNELNQMAMSQIEGVEDRQLRQEWKGKIKAISEKDDTATLFYLFTKALVADYPNLRLSYIKLLKLDNAILEKALVLIPNQVALKNTKNPGKYGQQLLNETKQVQAQLTELYEKRKEFLKKSTSSKKQLQEESSNSLMDSNKTNLGFFSQKAEQKTEVTNPNFEEIANKDLSKSPQ